MTAWLGLVAMWLIVLAPLVSQCLDALHRDDGTTAAICSVVQPATDAQHLSHTDPLAACGYCDLLADHTVLPALPPTSLVLVVLIVIAAVPALLVRFSPLGAFPSGRPRAPPALS